jgi:hypothetical protein
MPMPAIRNLTIHQNTEWSETFDIRVDDVAMTLEDFSFVGQVRKGQDVSSALMFAFAFDKTATEVTMSVDSSVTAVLNLSNEPADAQYFYDVAMIDSVGRRTKILKGRVTLERTVST